MTSNGLLTTVLSRPLYFIFSIHITVGAPADPAVGQKNKSDKFFERIWEQKVAVQLRGTRTQVCERSREYQN